MPDRRLDFIRMVGLNGEGVDVGLHHLTEGRIDRPVPLEPILAFERGRHDHHSEVTAPVPGPCVAGVEVTLVFDLERGKWVLWLNWPGENRSGSSKSLQTRSRSWG